MYVRAVIIDIVFLRKGEGEGEMEGEGEGEHTYLTNTLRSNAGKRWTAIT